MRRVMSTEGSWKDVHVMLCTYLLSLADLALQLRFQRIQFLASMLKSSVSSHTGFQLDPVGFRHLSLRTLQLRLKCVHLLLQLLALQISPCSIL